MYSPNYSDIPLLTQLTANVHANLGYSVIDLSYLMTLNHIVILL